MKLPSPIRLAIREAVRARRAIGLSAAAVGLEAQRAGVAPTTSPEALRDRVTATQWVPEYRRRAGEG